MIEEHRKFYAAALFVSVYSKRQEIKSRVARRNQAFIILGGMVYEIFFIVLGTVVFVGPFIFEFMKGKLHDTITEQATRESMWHTMDNLFAYFVKKIASPAIMVGRRVAVAGNHLHKMGVWLHLVKEVPVETLEELEDTSMDEEAAFKRFCEFSL